MQPKQIQDTRVTVVGGARSGLAALALLRQAGALPFLTEHGSGTLDLKTHLEHAHIPHELGGHTDQALDADFIVVSPGVPSSIPLLQKARARHLPIYSEVEVASWFCKADIIAITGSNGKTTTTSLLGHLIRSSGRQVHVAGNIGTAFSDIVLDTQQGDLVVLEVSSFQLDHTDRFRPRVSILLNITPDHLDRYNNRFDEYAASKFRIFKEQQSGDALIYNDSDPVIKQRVDHLAPSRHVNTYPITLDTPVSATHSTSQQQEIRDGAFLRDSQLVIRLNQVEEILMRKEELALHGPHNVFNSLAAAMAARVMEIPSLAVRESLSSFEGVSHRLEFVREIDGVRFVNDSKATNVNAVWYALETFQQPILLIAGGRDKGNDYTTLKPLVRRKVRALITLGEGAATLNEELGDLVDEHMEANKLEDAVRAAHLLAQPGDVVLLSPACASFDMFDNYEDRGDAFKKAVMSL